MQFFSRVKLALFLCVVSGLTACMSCAGGSGGSSSTTVGGGPTPTPTPPGHLIQISWQASSSPQAAKYNVYRSTVTGGPYALVGWGVSGTSYSDTTVKPGATYFYVVTSVTTSNVESVISPEVKATVPSP
jgi:hypothetical protein